VLHDNTHFQCSSYTTLSNSVYQFALMPHINKKQSCYMPGVAQRVPWKLRFPDYMTMAHEGGKVVSLTHRPPLPRENAPGTHFCQRLSRPQSHCAIGRIMSMKNSSDTIWNPTSDLPIRSTVPQPLCHHQRSPPDISKTS
jgi:hypothetical protein